MIETERLILRPIEDRDYSWLIAQSASPVVMQHLGGPQDAADVRPRLDRMRALEAERGFSFWAVERREDGQPIGFCGLKLVDAPNAPDPGDLEIGWRLDPACWGQGYAREAAEATLDFAFGRLAALHVVAFTSIGNSASWGLMERLGMIRRADMDFDDPRYDEADNPTIVYRIDANQWSLRDA